jgi:PKD repeat protein
MVAKATLVHNCRTVEARRASWRGARGRARRASRSVLAVFSVVLICGTVLPARASVGGGGGPTPPPKTLPYCTSLPAKPSGMSLNDWATNAWSSALTNFNCLDEGGIITSPFGTGSFAQGSFVTPSATLNSTVTQLDASKDSSVTTTLSITPSASVPTPIYSPFFFDSPTYKVPESFSPWPDWFYGNYAPFGYAYYRYLDPSGLFWGPWQQNFLPVSIASVGDYTTCKEAIPDVPYRPPRPTSSCDYNISILSNTVPGYQDPLGVNMTRDTQVVFGMRWIWAVVGTGPGGGKDWYTADNQTASALLYIKGKGSASKPTAAFTATPLATPGQYHFVSSSTDPDPSDTLSYDWNYGDNTAHDIGDNNTHTYTKPGTYTATLTVTDLKSLTDSTSQQITVKAPTLGVSVAVVGGSANVAPGDDVKADVTVSASADGVGNLTNVHFDPSFAPGLISGPSDLLDFVSGPSPGLPATFAPGDSTTMHFDFTAGDHVGKGTLSSKVLATDASSNAVSTTGSANVQVSNHAVTVTVTPSKNDFTLAKDASTGKPKPEDVDVTIDVENTSDDDVTNVDVGPLQLASEDPAHPYEPFPAAVTGANSDVTYDTLAAHEKKTIHRTVHVTADGRMLLKTLETSSDGAVLGTEKLHVGVTTLLTMTIDGDPTISIHAGSPFTIRGRFKNVTNDRTVAITDPMKVRTSGNVLGAGVILDAATADNPDEVPVPLVGPLKPGQEAEFEVKLSTDRPTVEDYDQGTASTADWTNGTVSFLFSPRSAAKEDDGSWQAMSSDVCFCKYPNSIDVTGGDAGHVFDVNIDTTEPNAGGGSFDRFASSTFGFSAGALEGAQNRLSGLLELLVNTGKFVFNSDFRDQTLSAELKKDGVRDTLEYLSDVAVWLPNATTADLEKTVGQKLSDALSKFTDVVTGGIPHPESSRTAVVLAAQAHSYIEHLQGAWRRGDPNELVDAVSPVGGIAGEQATDLLVPEAVFESVGALARAPKYLNAAAEQWSNANTIAKMQAELPSAAQLAIDNAAIEVSKSKFPSLENAYTTGRSLGDVELGAGLNNDGAGLAKDTIDAARQWSRDNPNRTIVINPNEANVAAMRDADLAVGKIENVKPKTLSTIEFDVFGGRPQDVNTVVLRNLNMTDAQINQAIDDAIAAGKIVEDDRVVALQIAKKRKQEWTFFNARGNPVTDPVTGKVLPDSGGIGKLKTYDEAGHIPNQFRGADNGLSINGQIQNPKFHLEYYDAAGNLTDEAHGSYVVLKQESPISGKLVSITGDDDGIFIGLANGLGLQKNALEQAYTSLMNVFNHPFTDTWLAEVKDKLKIFSKNFTTIPGTGIEGTPLVAFVNGDAYAVKIDPFKTRFDTVTNRAFVAFTGMPVGVDVVPSLSSFVAALFRPVANLPLPATFLRMFLHIPGAATNPNIPPIPTGKKARVIRINQLGQVESWTPNGGWQLDPEAQQEAGNGTIVVAPQTQVFGSTQPGATEVQISSQSQMGMAGDWFDIGDQVVLDPGGPHQETATIGGFGSLIFTSPLTQPHDVGELIVFVPHDVVEASALARTGLPIRDSAIESLAFLMLGLAYIELAKAHEARVSSRRRPSDG